jgi:hypothetical protein
MTNNERLQEYMAISDEIALEAAQALLDEIRYDLSANNKYFWSEPVKMNAFSNTKAGIGVYRIFHGDPETGEEVLCYVGQGRIYSRLNIHRELHWKNKRKPDHTKFNSLAIKLFAHDENADNFYVQYVTIDNKDRAKALEDKIIKTEKPLYNDRKMAGRG